MSTILSNDRAEEFSAHAEAPPPSEMVASERRRVNTVASQPVRRFRLNTTMTQIGVQRHSRTRSRHLSIGFVKNTKYAIAASFVVLTVVLFLVTTFGRTAPVSSGPENRDSRSGPGESGTIKALPNLRVGNREEDSNHIALGKDAALDAAKAAKAAVEAAMAAVDAVKDEDANSVVADSTVMKQIV